MANTYVDYTATAGQTDFAFSFPFLEDSHVIVEVEGVNQALTTNYTIETSPAQKIVLSSPTTALAGGELVRIKRVSDPSTNLVDFVNGSVLTETELDRAYLHNRYLSEEAYDGVNAGLGELEGSTNYNANNKQIKNLADGTLATDAVNKGYVDTQIALTDTNLAGFFKSTHTGNAVDNVFTLSFTPQTTDAKAYIVSIDGLVQVPDTDYTIGATDITFNAIPANSAEICVVATAASSVATINEAQVTATGSTTARSLADRFGDVVNVLDYGVKNDGTDHSTGDSNATRIQAAFDSGAGEVFFPDGSYLIDSQLNIGSSSSLDRIYGNASLLIDHAGADYPSSTAGIDADKPVTVEGLTFIAQNTDHSNTVTDANSTDWTVNTRDFLIGMRGMEGSTFKNVRWEHFFTALRINGSFDSTKRTQVIGCQTIQCGGGSAGVRPNMNFYQCNDLLLQNHYAYIGAEVTFPSNRRAVITDSVFILPNKPTIDVGGSASAITEEVIISNNISYGRDPIVCELGANKVNINNNICIVTMTQPDGIGIGVTSARSGQSIPDITITNNTVRLIGDNLDYGSLANPIAQGIKVHNTSTAAGFDSVVRRVLISNNTVNIAASFGIYVDADYAAALYGQEVVISNNVTQECTRNIYAERINGLVVCDNTGEFATNFALIKNCGNFCIKGNISQSISSGTHYVIDAPVEADNQIFIEHTNAATDAEAISIINAAVTAALPYMESNVGGTYGTTRIKTGSIARNTSPSSGNYIGRVCTSGGVSNTVWANYGEIA